jgi:hypothetical protein
MSGFVAVNSKLFSLYWIYFYGYHHICDISTYLFHINQMRSETRCHTNNQYLVSQLSYIQLICLDRLQISTWLIQGSSDLAFHPSYQDIYTTSLFNPFLNPQRNTTIQQNATANFVQTTPAPPKLYVEYLNTSSYFLA